jgi:hypothetical protein
MRRPTIAITALSALCLVTACSDDPPSDEELRAEIARYYDSEGSWAGEFEIQSILCLQSSEPEDGVMTADVAYKFCRAGQCAKMAGVDVRTFTLVEDDGWTVDSMGDHLSGSCDPGPIDPVESMLTGHMWNLVEYEYPDAGTTSPAGPTSWEFPRTAVANGSLYVAGGYQGEWWLSEIPWGEFTLEQGFTWYLVNSMEGYAPYTYGIAATGLDLQHDVGVNDNRIDRFVAQ